MPYEIERKFLVDSAKWQEILDNKNLYKSLVQNKKEILQGYISLDKERTGRIRLTDDSGFIAVKGKTIGAKRLEFEYPIPTIEAKEILYKICERPLIEKTRYYLKQDKMIWTIDDFFGQNSGLMIAEIELPTEDTLFALPEWIGEEVTDDPRYFNSNLVKNPFSTWKNSK